MIVTYEIMFSANGCSKTIEMKMFVVNGTVLQKKITFIECRNQNTFIADKNGWISLNKCGITIEKIVLTSKKRCLRSTVYTEMFEDKHSDPRPIGSTNNGNRCRVLLPHGGNGADPDSLPHNSKKVNNRELLSNGTVCCLPIFDEIPRRMDFTNSFYFVTDKSFTVDGDLW